MQEVIDVCADFLYSGEHELPPVDKDILKELLRLCTCNVITKTHDDFYCQIDVPAIESSSRDSSL